VGFGIPEKAKFWKRLFKRKPQQLAKPPQPEDTTAAAADAAAATEPLVGAASGKMASVPEGEDEGAAATASDSASAKAS